MKKILSIFVAVALFAGISYATDFAPNSATVTSLGTKGTTTVLLGGLLQQYKFDFVNTSDYVTAALGKVTFYNAAGTSLGTGYTTGDTFKSPVGAKSAVLGAYSSATPKSVILWKMNR